MISCIHDINNQGSETRQESIAVLQAQTTEASKYTLCVTICIRCRLIV